MLTSNVSSVFCRGVHVTCMYVVSCLRIKHTFYVILGSEIYSQLSINVNFVIKALKEGRRTN